MLSQLLVVPVPAVVAALLLLALLVGLLLLRVRQPLWAAPAALGALAALAMLVAGPRVAPVPQGAPLQNLGGVANFADRYNQARTLYGAPVGACAVANGFLSCYTVYTRMEAHPEESQAEWQVQNGNLGLQLALARQEPLVPNAVTPAVVAAYLAAERQQGMDTLYWIGNPRTNPVLANGRYYQYFDKALLSWPQASEDPASVQREPVGNLVWSITQQRQDPAQPNPWTPARLWLASGAAVGSLIAALPLLLPGLARRRQNFAGI